MNVSYGLDLAGYSSGGSALARATWMTSDRVNVLIKRNSVFSKKFKGSQKLSEVNRQELAELNAMIDEGIVVIDVCIDLQGLLCPTQISRLWELTRRPVDRAFTALCPLADKIGAYVARIQKLYSELRQKHGDLLGERLFETYPSASLELMKVASTKYKGTAKLHENGWEGIDSAKPDEVIRNNELASTLNTLQWAAPLGFVLSHDEFDASICALTGLVKPELTLQGNQLDQRIRTLLLDKNDISQAEIARMHAPLGYRLLSSRVSNVWVSEI
jgi:hypothetical protein